MEKESVKRESFYYRDRRSLSTTEIGEVFLLQRLEKSFYYRDWRKRVCDDEHFQKEKKERECVMTSTFIASPESK